VGRPAPVESTGGPIGEAGLVLEPFAVEGNSEIVVRTLVPGGDARRFLKGADGVLHISMAEVGHPELVEAGHIVGDPLDVVGEGTGSIPVAALPQE